MKFPRLWKRDSDGAANAGIAAEEDRVGMHGPAPVLDDAGKPLDKTLSPEDREALSEEAAHPELIGYRSLWDQSIARGLTPEGLAAILQQTKRGDIRPFLELAEEMEERDLHYLAVLSTRKVHDEVRIDILEDDADEIAVTVNRDLVKWFVKLNFGDNAEAPVVRFPVAEPQDVAVQATALAQLVPLGLKVSQQEVLDKIGFTRPDDGDELLVPPAAAAPAAKPAPDASQAVRMASTLRALDPRRCSCGCGTGVVFNAEGIGPAPNDAPIAESAALVGDALDDWEEIADPLLRQLIDLAHGAKSLDEVLRRVTAARLDVGALAEKLAVATAISRGLGDLKD